MKRIKICGILLVLLALLLCGCSTEGLMDRGTEFLDKMFSGEFETPKIPIGSTSSSSPKTDPAPAEPEDGDGEDSGSVEPVESVIPASKPDPNPPSVPSEPSAPTAPSTAAPSSGTVTASHTDVTFFGPGEFFNYRPKGVEGTYACEYASKDTAVATVDSATGKVTAVGPGTTKVTMHVESNGQYDFECIVRCNWKEEEKPSGSSGAPSTGAEPVLPPEPTTPSASGAISASHSDATFFGPKEFFKFLPVGAGSDYTCTYTTKDANVATVSDKGVVTAVAPGMTTVTMTVDAGGTEYIFNCIVRCNWT